MCKCYSSAKESETVKHLDINICGECSDLLNKYKTMVLETITVVEQDAGEYEDTLEYEITTAYCKAHYYRGEFWGWNIYGINAIDGTHVLLGTYDEKEDAEYVCGEILKARNAGKESYVVPVDVIEEDILN